MEPRLQRATKALVIERIAVGGLVALAPGRVIRAIAPPGSDAEAARYMARLLGIRQVVLGVMLWQSRHDRARLRRMATLNAATEVLDAAVAFVRAAAAWRLRFRGARRRVALNVGGVPRPPRGGVLSTASPCRRPLDR